MKKKFIKSFKFSKQSISPTEADFPVYIWSSYTILLT